MRSHPLLVTGIAGVILAGAFSTMRLSTGSAESSAETRVRKAALAPLVRAARAAGHELRWVDAGQHTDHAMQERIRLDAGLPEAHV